MSLGTYFLTFRKNRGVFIYQKGCSFMNTAVLAPSLANTSFVMERAFAWQLLRTISLSGLRYRMGGCDDSD